VILGFMDWLGDTGSTDRLLSDFPGNGTWHGKDCSLGFQGNGWGLTGEQEPLTLFAKKRGIPPFCKGKKDLVSIDYMTAD